MHLSFVLLGTPYDVDAPAILEAHARLFPAKPMPREVSSEPELAELQGHGGLTTHVALMQAAVPNGEAEAAAKQSLATLGEDQSRELAHVAHLIVTTHGEDADTLLRHTRIVAACVDAYGAVGVYEGNARATHIAPFYLDIATTDDEPLQLWTGLSIGGDGGGRSSVLTLGVRSTLNLPDLLVSAPSAAGGDALDFLFNILAYIIQRGAALPDGDTIGRSATEKIKVKYVPSPVDPSQRVMRLDL